MSNQLKKARNLATLGGGALVAASPFVVTGTAHAATITVDSLADDGSGGTTLREAIAQANSNADADVITFDAGLTGTITLTGTLNLYHSVDIQGPGASVLTIDGDDKGVVFYAYDTTGVADIAISGLTITGGLTSKAAGGIVAYSDNLTLEDVVITGNTGDSGGVYFSGNYTGDDATFTITNCDISGNTGTTYAGGIYLYSGGDVETPSLVIQDSTVSGNNAASGWGGGLYIREPEGIVYISNSTFSGNTVGPGYDGGGIFLNDSSAGIHIVNSTITANSARYGGGVFVEDSTATVDAVIENTIIAGNTATGVVPAALSDGNDVYGQETATLQIDYSFIGSPGGYTSTGANNLSGDPKLGALADNGGDTKTHLPDVTSPVVNAGDPAYDGPLTLDQRDEGRIYNGRIDMGAVEVQTTPPPPVLPPTGGSNGLMAGLGAALLGLGGALHLTGRRKRSV